MSDPIWIKHAKTFIGLKEGPGAADNPKVVAFYAKAGHPEVKHDSVPWCAAFVGGVLADKGIKPTGTLWALDYAKYGTKLSKPAVGAIATKKRKGGGHVFFVVGWDATHVWGLGGNQGDEVCIVRYPRSILYSYTWPSKAVQPDYKDQGVKVARSTGPISEA